MYAMLPLNYEMLPETHTMEKCDFLKPIIHSKIFNSQFLMIESFSMNCKVYEQTDMFFPCHLFKGNSCFDF